VASHSSQRRRAAADAAARRASATERITGTAGKPAPSPAHTPRTLLDSPAPGAQVAGSRARWAALCTRTRCARAVALATARAGGVARIVHVRDCLPRGAVSDATLRLIAANSTTVLANSRYTADSVLAVAPRARVEVAYSPVDTARFDRSRFERAWARTRLGAAGEHELLLASSLS